MSQITTEIRAIDPLAILLSHEVYIKLTLPDPPPIEAIIKQLNPAFRGISAAERAQTLARAKTLGAYAAAVEKALSSKG